MANHHAEVAEVVVLNEISQEVAQDQRRVTRMFRCGRMEVMKVKAIMDDGSRHIPVLTRPVRGRASLGVGRSGEDLRMFRGISPWG